MIRFCWSHNVHGAYRRSHGSALLLAYISWRNECVISFNAANLQLSFTAEHLASGLTCTMLAFCAIPNLSALKLRCKELGPVLKIGKTSPCDLLSTDVSSDERFLDAFHFFQKHIYFATFSAQ